MSASPSPSSMSASSPSPSLTRRVCECQREHWTGSRAADLNAEQLMRAKAAGYEPGPDGYMVGRDPRTMTASEFEAMRHERLSPMEAIRVKCLDCCAGSPHEVRLCVAMACPSWPFRMGRSPWREKPSEERLEAMRERGRRLANADKSLPPEAETGTAATEVASEVPAHELADALTQNEIADCPCSTCDGLGLDDADA
jgi:hypothetical protein